MPQIFLNFRTDDEPYGANHLDRELCREFGEDAIFFAPRSIPAGADWARTIFGALAECEVVLVVMGPRWLTLTTTDGRPRISDPEDFVGREIHHALRAEKTVIPVHMEQQHRIDRAALPRHLGELAAKQGVVVTFRDSRPDIAKLVRALRGLVPALPPEPAARPSGPRNVIHGSVFDSNVVQADQIHGNISFGGPAKG